MTLSEKQLLALVRAGLSGRVDEPDLFSGALDWQTIYDLSVAQTVTPLVTEGIDLLPDAQKPDIDLLEPFLADTLATEKRNDALDRFIRGLYRLLYSSGIPALLVKGQALAPLYPNPRHRQPGDIDILVLPEDYEKTKELIVPRATSVESEQSEILHQAMAFGSIEVEVHGTVSTLMSVRLDRKLAAWMEEMFRAGDFPEVSVGSFPVKTPPVLFNAVYILIHFLHHYWSSGVGLRQLLDWALFVSRHADGIDKPRLEAVLRDMGIFRLWQTFAGVSVAAFGLPAERIPFCTDRYRGKYDGILRYLFKTGNFGLNAPRESKERSYLARKIHSFWQLVICDRLRHFPEFPAESLRYFFGATHYGIIRLSEGV